jgi:hypothetical protein
MLKASQYPTSSYTIEPNNKNNTVLAQKHEGKPVD